MYIASERILKCNAFIRGCCPSSFKKGFSLHASVIKRVQEIVLRLRTGWSSIHKYNRNLPRNYASNKKKSHVLPAGVYHKEARDVWQNGQHGGVEQISKMAMRRILETSFQRLALNDPAIDAVYKQWLATSEKPKRKSIASAKRHTADWHWRRQQQGVRKR